jgi:hypothetical protein
MTKPGKVIEFKPRDKKKLKTPDYVDPTKKELLRQRELKKKKDLYTNQPVRYMGIFLIICAFVYLITVR